MLVDLKLPQVSRNLGNGSCNSAASTLRTLWYCYYACFEERVQAIQSVLFSFTNMICKVQGCFFGGGRLNRAEESSVGRRLTIDIVWHQRLRREVAEDTAVPVSDVWSEDGEGDGALGLDQ